MTPVIGSAPTPPHSMLPTPCARSSLLKSLRGPSCILSTAAADRSEEHPSELQSLMRISYVVFCLKKTTNHVSSNYYVALYGYSRDSEYNTVLRPNTSSQN